MSLELALSIKYKWILLITGAKSCSPNYYRKSNNLVQLIFENVSDLLISNATVREQERLGQCKGRRC